MRIRIRSYHFQADPGPIFCSDVDPNPDPIFHYDVDPDPALAPQRGDWLRPSRALFRDYTYPEPT